MPTRRPWIRWTAGAVILIAVVVVIVLVASGGGDDKGGATRAAKGSADGAAGDTLVIAARKTPDGIDGEFFYNQEDQAVRNAVYNHLLALPVTTNRAGATVPDYDKTADQELTGDLAESWKLSNAGRTLTFKLKHGVFSHAGNELTAADVQYSWDRGWALKAATGGYLMRTVLRLKHPTWKVVDKYTWQVTTPSPNALLMPLFANNDLQIYDAKATKAHAAPGDPWATKWLKTHDAGSGPYQVSEYSPGNRVVLKRFDKYFAQKPAYKTVIYRAIPDASERQTLVQTGAVGVAENISYRALSQLKGSKNAKVWPVAGNSMAVLVPQTNKAPYNNVDFRKALSYATPTQQILQDVYFGFGSLLKGAVPSSYPFASPASGTYTYDVDKAKEYLKQSGVPSSKKLILHYDSSRADHANIAAILKTSYAQLGINLQLQADSSSTFFTKYWSRKFDLALQVNSANTPDAGYAIALIFACGGPYNVSGWCSRAVDGDLTKGLATRDRAERTEIYRDAQDKINDAAPSVWVANPGFQLLTKPTIGGVEWNPAGMEVISALRPAAES